MRLLVGVYQEDVFWRRIRRVLNSYWVEWDLRVVAQHLAEVMSSFMEIDLHLRTIDFPLSAEKLLLLQQTS